MNSRSDHAPVSALPGRFPGLLLLGLGLFTTLPVFWAGNVIGEDTLAHLVLSRHFIDQLAAGELYPRWLAGLNDGLGSPVMFFYGPVPYYITALFRPLAGSDPEGWHQLGMASALAVIASGFTAYAWLRRLANEQAALIGALLYMAAPYPLMVDLYQRFAFAELWGFAWMPLVLWWVHAVVEGRKGAWLWLAASYTLLIMTHLSTTLLFSVLPPLYALWLAKPGGRLAVGAKVVAGMLLGIGLSAVFLLPALWLQPFVQFQIMESGKFYFGNNFLFYGPRASPGVNESLNYLAVVMGGSIMLILGAYGLGRKLLPPSGEYLARFWLLAGLAAFFMLLPISKPVWELFPVLQKVQFPSRFGTLVTLAMAALLTLWLSSAGRLLARDNIALLAIVGLTGLIQTIPMLKVYQIYPIWSQKPSLVWLQQLLVAKGESTWAIIETAKKQGYTYFLPNQAPSLLFNEPMKSLDTLRKLAAVPEAVALSPAPGATLQLSQMTSRHWALEVRSESPLSVRLRQFYFPGWIATSPGISGELKLRPARDSGLIEMGVPAGRHHIDLTLQATPAERAGQIISLLSAMVFLAGWARLRYLARGGNRFFSVRRNVPVQVEAADQSSRLKQD